MASYAKKRNQTGQKQVKTSGENDKKETKTDMPEKAGRVVAEDDEPWTPGAYTVFKIVLSARLCAAAWNIVGDCDETFNYWEPTHFLMFGKGFQTWEYSPTYAIRSYAYIFLHTLPMRLYGLVFTPNPVMLFFFLRCVLALSCALCEMYFYKGVCRQFGNNVGRILLCFMLFSAGTFISCTAYLPSSFCMYMTYLSLGGWFLGRYEIAIAATAASVLMGWPFAGIIGVSIALDILLRKKKVALFVMWSCLSLLVFLIPTIMIDQYYYGKLLLAPLNIVMYNVFTEHGPDLYGTEPFSYYFINGFLNFNVVFLMALGSLPFVLITKRFVKGPRMYIPAAVVMAPMYLWILVFFTRPHKEERFLFPVYPFFIMCGAVTVDYLQRVCHRLLSGQRKIHYTDTTGGLAVFFCIFFSLLSVSRIVAVYQAYHAPLDIFVELNKIALDPKIHTLSPEKPVNICVGKEWYRFPSSFFLPGLNWNLQYIQSEFKGQLPKPYSTGKDATKIIPTHMNDMNKEEPSRYVNISKCHYLFDLDLPNEAPLEPRYSQNTDDWKILTSVQFLDASRSHRVLRAFYIPFVSSSYCSYVNYNLLRTTRTRKNTKNSPTNR